MKRSVKEIAKGRWPSILPQLGIDKKFLVNRHGPCPMCEGRDRFRFDDKGDGRWFCNQCGAGDGVELVKQLLRVDFKEAVRRIEEVAEGAPIAIRQGPDPAKIRDEMNAIWRAGVGLCSVPGAAAWWKARIGDVPEIKDAKAVQALTYPGARTVHPGMVVLVRGFDGKPVNMHRTFLSHTGEKASVPEARMVMPGSLPDGCAVRLFDHAEVLGIAEGIETAVAASRLFKVPVWASLNAGRLEAWRPPEGVRVVVFGDNDLSFTGQAAAYALAKRLRREKREVEVRIPTQPGWDWNDVFLKAGRVSVANDQVAA